MDIRFPDYYRKPVVTPMGANDCIIATSVLDFNITFRHSDQFKSRHDYASGQFAHAPQMRQFEILPHDITINVETSWDGRDALAFDFNLFGNYFTGEISSGKEWRLHAFEVALKDLFRIVLSNLDPSAGLKPELSG